MYFTVYKTVNLKTSQYYIGVHKTNNPNDEYYGSGLRIIRSIKKYSKENFKKIVLFCYDKSNQAFLMETEILDSCLDDEKCLNLARGGKGGANFAGKKHTEETKRLLKEKRKLHPPLSISIREKIAKFMRKRIISDKTRKLLSIKASQRMLSDEEKNKISKSLKRYYKGHKEKGCIINVYERTDEHKKEHSSIMKNVYANKNLIWIKNIDTNESFRIEANEFQFYNERGFIRGRILTQRGQGR